MHASYAEKGLSILGFPCNQFNGQASSNNSLHILKNGSENLQKCHFLFDELKDIQRCFFILLMNV